MHTIQYTLYGIHYSMHNTLYTIQYTVYNVHCTMYSNLKFSIALYTQHINLDKSLQ